MVPRAMCWQAPTAVRALLVTTVPPATSDTACPLHAPTAVPALVLLVVTVALVPLVTMVSTAPATTVLRRLV